MNKLTPSSHMHRVPDITRPIVGLIPAAGLAKRLGLQGCSKELQAIRIGSQNNLPGSSVSMPAGRNLEAVHFPQGRFLDIGTPERLAQSAKFMTQLNEH